MEVNLFIDSFLDIIFVVFGPDFPDPFRVGVVQDFRF